MCGIVGFTSEKQEEEKIKSFTKSLSHRGPDQENYTILKFGEKYLHLGSSRLIITGNEKDYMPMFNSHGDCIVYNGEVFDLSRLKQNLEKPLQSTNDTKHLLNFCSDANKNYNDINGMFAFAFYSKKSNKLTLARDKLGIKPLYYSIDNDKNLSFCSEINSLSEFCGQKKVNKTNVEKALVFNGLTAENNIIENIVQLKPGTVLDYNSSGEINIKNYIQDTNLKIQKDLQTTFENTMLETLEDHLLADTDVDMFLSGGVDSSIMAYLISKKLNKKIRHFSLSFDNPSYSEEDSFLSISKHLNLMPKVFKLKDNDIPELVEESLLKMNSLVLDPSYVPTFYLCQKTSEYTKAVVSGDGADELFGGYEWYRALKIKKLFPNVLIKLFSEMLNDSNSNANINYLSYKQKIEYFLKNIHSSHLIQILSWQSPKLKFDQSDISEIQKYLNNINFEDSNIFEQVKKLDISTYMYTNILQKVDIASMANGLEVRPVFLDDRVVDFANLISIKEQVSYSKTKLFLRKYMISNGIPNSNLPKHGFSFPIHTWYLLKGKYEIKDLIKKDSYIKSIFSKNIFSINFDSPNNNELRIIWALYVLENWLTKNKLELI